mgnify:CR=1 FL=1
MIDKKIEEYSNYCLNCKVKPCSQKGCPLSNNIPAFIKCVKDEDLKQAYMILTKTTMLGSVCGRICPHEKQCQGSCVRGIKSEPVHIGEIEAYVFDNGLKNEYYKEIEKSNTLKDKKIAVIGSGPASLNASAFLAMAGADVTIYEKQNELGGILSHGIPEFRLNRDVLNSTINQILSLGIKIKKGITLGKDIDLEELKKNYDAVFIDIDMPMMNGIDFANQYKLKHLDTFIIFVTNHSELVFDTFKVHPFDFIRKEHFDLEIERVIEELIFLLDKKNKKIQVKSNGEIIQIKLVDILFCESNKHNCYIYKNNNTCIKVRMKLSEIYKLLDSDIFFQVNKSFLINWNCVEKISNGMIIYENGLCFNISRPMIKEAKRLFLVRKAESV